MKKSQAPILESTHTGRPSRDGFFKFQAARLVLADGAAFDGQAPVWQADGPVGEVVFNTGMTGYVETLTDPSYSGQVLTFTYPLIGNYGVPGPDTWESDRMHLRGIVISELAEHWSHTGSTQSLLEWARQQNVPVITGVDTRALTKHLRTHGTIAGQITASVSNTVAPFEAPAIVSVAEPRIYNETGRKLIIAVDCGMKENIIRHLVALGAQVKRVPHNYDYSNEPYDGVLVSNGPGDPTDYAEAIEILRRAMDNRRPVFGVCLGVQLMALAAGGSTYKLKFGHRGHNQPAIMPDGRAVITSQNHGYAINEDSLPNDWKATFRNLNDGSVEGIAHDSLPFSAVQFHPEAAPGPTDTAWLFERFYRSL